MRIWKAAAIFLLVLVCAATGCTAEAATLTLEWDPPIDGVTTGYVVYIGPATGVYAAPVDVGFTTSYTLPTIAEGATYYFTVAAYDAIGQMSPAAQEVSTTIPRTTVTSLALISSVPSPQYLGAVVTWAATASGGIAPYEYQWSVNDGQQWTATPWTTASTWTWAPSTTNSNYRIQVGVRSAGNTGGAELTQSVPFVITARPTVNGVTLSANVPSPQMAGSTITWAAAASGGTAPYEYKWWVSDGVSWGAMTGWTGASTWAWKPTVASSNYAVRVWVRSSGATTDVAEASTAVPFVISAPAVSNKKCNGNAAKCR